MKRIVIALLLLGLPVIAVAQQQAPPPVGTFWYDNTASPPIWRAASDAFPFPVNASVSATVGGFAPSLAYATCTATGSSCTSTALPTNTGSVVLFNSGTTTVSCTLASGAATALASELQIPASSGLPLATVYGATTYDHFACIDQSGSASNVVIASGGSGLPTGWGGGGSGGSGGAVTIASGGVASGAYAAGSIASGAMVDLGSQADNVCGSSTGSCSLIALIKYLNNAAVSAVPAYYATAYNTCSQVTGTTAPICVDLNGNMYANISRYFGTVASPNASIMTVQPAGGDPCQTLAKTYTPINYSASGLNTTPLVAGTSGKKTYVCQIILNNNAAETVGIIETTTATSCATDVQALWGGATHSSSSAGFQFAATSGVSIGNGTSTVAITKTANDDICFIQSQATQMTGGILWVQQ